MLGAGRLLEGVARRMACAGRRREGAGRRRGSVLDGNVAPYTASREAEKI